MMKPLLQVLLAFMLMIVQAMTVGDAQAIEKKAAIMDVGCMVRRAF